MKTSIRILFPLVAVLMLSACASHRSRARLEELEMENADLRRQREGLEADLAACRAQRDALERELREEQTRRLRDAARPEEKETLPGNLEREGLSLKTNRYGQPVINVPSDVFFGSGVSQLSEGGRKVLRDVAAFISDKYPGSRLSVEGHTDTDPIRRTKGRYHCNWDLSLERAHSVLHFLADDLKFDPKTMMCAGYGQYRPADPANKAKNRRVEIVILR